MEYAFDVGKARYAMHKPGYNPSELLHCVGLKELAGNIYLADNPMFSVDRMERVLRVLLAHPKVFFVHNVFRFDKAYLAFIPDYKNQFRLTRVLVKHYDTHMDIYDQLDIAFKKSPLEDAVMFVRIVANRNHDGVELDYLLLPERGFNLYGAIRRNLIADVLKDL